MPRKTRETAKRIKEKFIILVGLGVDGRNFQSNSPYFWYFAIKTERRLHKNGNYFLTFCTSGKTFPTLSLSLCKNLLQNLMVN